MRQLVDKLLCKCYNNYNSIKLLNKTTETNQYNFTTLKERML
uniref:Uncharacterized protein n=1 Tax=virus sp. ctmTa7 TaxID=2828255 RepID=A0A8S5RBL2_9VIRU|nr:MAG TPA: hypothetical protein [virus sp. ctmTa7]